MAREIVYKFSSCFINDIRSRRRVPPLIRQMCHPCSRWVHDCLINSRSRSM